MRAIILAAGVGKRLEHLGDGPKCLLEFGGVSLLRRHLEALGRLGIVDVTVCVGYQAARIVKTIEAAQFANVSCVVNDDYREGSVVSLWCARQTLREGDSVIVMDADVLYAPAILARLVGSRADNCLLLDRGFEAGDEPVKICLQNGLVVAFGKTIAPGVQYDCCGESIGFFKFSAAMGAALATMTEYYLTQGRRAAPHEDALGDLLLSRPRDFSCEDVTGLPWIEIDFPVDVTRAEQDILPLIDER